MIKTLIISLLLFFTVQSQTIWYVDRDASGSANGTSWANAWNSLDQIVWNSISAGDTIYMSGGSDSTVYRTSYPYDNCIILGSPYKTFASGNPVVIARAWESGHNGNVYFLTINDTRQYLFHIRGVSNIKFYDVKFYDVSASRTGWGGSMYIGGGNQGDIDSLMYFENCEFVGSGNGTLVYCAGTKISFKNCLMQHLYNTKLEDQDIFSASSGRGGYTFDSCRLIYGNETTVGVTAHRDVMQFSNFGIQAYNETMTVTIKNCFIIAPYDGASFNAIIYHDGAETNVRWWIYNNVIMDNNTFGDPPLLTIGGLGSSTNYENLKQDAYILNNTFIHVSSPVNDAGSIIVMGDYDPAGQQWDSLVVMNNLIVKLAPTLFTYDINRVASYSMQEFIDYNYYYSSNGFTTDYFSTGDGFGYWHYTEWLATGSDAHSDTNSVTAPTFANFLGTNLSDYYTETGRDLGTDLSAQFPFLQYDALSNSRSGTWDMGALEYQAPSGTTTRRRVIVIQ